MVTLAEAEAETASRVGPFYALTATGGTADAVVVAGLRTSAELGGYEGLYLLRREATQATDRVRTVDRVDGPSGGLLVDYPYTGTPAPGEAVELHHLHPDLQLRADVRAGLRRCYVVDELPVVAPAVPVVPPQGGVLLDLTAQAFWLTAPRQVLSVAAGGTGVAPPGRYGDPGPGGWSCYATRGRLYLALPAGVPAAGLTVRAYRDAFGLVDDLDAPAGPAEDADELAVPLDYVAALAHAECWRRHRDRLEASAAEGRFPTHEEAAAEATRCASVYADFLFRPSNERPDRPRAPWGRGASSSPSGLGGTGVLAGAVVNQNDPYGAW
jgi:hypothetical protein